VELMGKTVVLTGASRGIGRALAIGLAGQGCRLLLSALESDELSALTGELRAGSSAQIQMMAADLTEPESRGRLIEWIRTREQPPDILINNAGGGVFGRFTGSTWPQIEKQILLNVHASTHLTYALLPMLKTRPSAMVVNLSSGIARLPYPGLAVYGAAKGFVSSLSESLACELAGTPVRVLCFHPGFTQTAFMDSAQMDMSRIPGLLLSDPEKTAARIIKAIRRNRRWAFGDAPTRLGTIVSLFIPAKLRTALFKNFYWRLPDET
jgi:short-subunit dehydrogenase